MCPKTQWARVRPLHDIHEIWVVDSMIFLQIMFNRHILFFVISLKDGVVAAVWCFFSFSFVGGDATPKFHAPDFWKKKVG